MNNKTQHTLESALGAYVRSVGDARSKNTARTYRGAVRAFKTALGDIDIENTAAENTQADWIGAFAQHLKKYSPATEQMYLSAIVGFYKFLTAEGIATPNLQRVEMMVRMRGRKPGKRLPQFPREAIESIIQYAEGLTEAPAEDEAEALRNLRDRAFILTLADTGLRVHEACNLKRGDVDMQEGQAILIGKGNREALVRFSTRSLKALTEYKSARAMMDGGSGKPLQSLPLFARHDKGAGAKVKPMGTATGRNIVKLRGTEALGSAESARSITPHSFRHYFVTIVLRGSGGNLKLAQELARHKNISVTQRYAHLSDDELDKGYHHIFEGA